MALTETQGLLLNGLELYKVEKGAIIGIMIMLQKEDQMNELMHYMASNPEMTQEEILEKAVEIATEDTP